MGCVLRGSAEMRYTLGRSGFCDWMSRKMLDGSPGPASVGSTPFSVRRTGPVGRRAVGRAGLLAHGHNHHAVGESRNVDEHISQLGAVRPSMPRNARSRPVVARFDCASVVEGCLQCIKNTAFIDKP